MEGLEDDNVHERTCFFGCTGINNLTVKQLTNKNQSATISWLKVLKPRYTVQVLNLLHNLAVARNFNAVPQNLACGYAGRICPGGIKI